MDALFVELRAESDGLRLSGVAVPYGTVTQLTGFREQFSAGAFGDLSTADVLLRGQHNPDRPLARTGGGGLTLSDSGGALRIDATLPDTLEARDTITLVRSRVLRGLSVGFKAVEDRWEGDLRTVVRAKLYEISVVDKPAYRTATLEARNRRARVHRGGFVI